METRSEWNGIMDEYCTAVAEARNAWDAISMRFDTTSNGLATNVPTKAEERRIAHARVHVRKIEAEMQAFLKNAPTERVGLG